MKKILIIAPLLAEWDNIAIFSQDLNFLESDYQVTYQDPLENLEQCETSFDFFRQWEEKWKMLSRQYDIFIGFSLGGLVLKIGVLRKMIQNKPIILISTPLKRDIGLAKKLSVIMEVVKNAGVNEGIQLLNDLISYAGEENSKTVKNPNVSYQRLIKGLNYVLQFPYRSDIVTPFLHIVGGKSKLVGFQHAQNKVPEILEVVSQAGMRVLQDAPEITKEIILNYLKEDQHEKIENSCLAG